MVTWYRCVTVQTSRLSGLQDWPEMPRFSDRPFFATTLSFLSSRAKRADLRCAIRVPRSYRPTTSTNHHRILTETPTSALSLRFPGVVRGTADRSTAGHLIRTGLSELAELSPG